jgi:hypothetical protein
VSHFRVSRASCCARVGARAGGADSGAAAAAGDSLAYTPRAELPSGRQVVVVYVGMTGCGASRDPELEDAVRRMKPALARQAAARGTALSINGGRARLGARTAASRTSGRSARGTR